MSNHKIENYQFAAEGDYPFDVEFISIQDLLKRGKINKEIKRKLSTSHRTSFNSILIITQGQYEHELDFERIPCGLRRYLIIKRGQVHRFDVDNPCEGWLVVFKPESISFRERNHAIDWRNIFETLENIIDIDLQDHHVVLALIEQMVNDIQRYKDQVRLKNLLNLNLDVLMLRLSMNSSNDEIYDGQEGSNLYQIYLQFKKLLDEGFFQQRQVKEYANKLGCSEKTLNRSVKEHLGISAKQAITDHLIVQAKRLLVHTQMSINAIAIELGFNEPTNFVKFFKRETEQSPKAFRDTF